MDTKNYDTAINKIKNSVLDAASHMARNLRDTADRLDRAVSNRDFTTLS